MTQPRDIEVVIWTRSQCPACTQAKRFLGRKNIEFKERRLKTDAASQRAFSLATNGARTVPQIMINGTNIGGFDDLLQLEKRGELDVLLGRIEPTQSTSWFQKFRQWCGF